jgi:hypothetical protein
MNYVHNELRTLNLIDLTPKCDWLMEETHVLLVGVIALKLVTLVSLAQM